MKFPILQTPVITEEDIVSKADSAKVTIEQFASNLATDPNTTLHNLLNDAIHFGIKVLVAILIYVVGAWFIKHIRNHRHDKYAWCEYDFACGSACCRRYGHRYGDERDGTEFRRRNNDSGVQAVQGRRFH